MSDATTIRQWAGEFDCPPPLVLQDEAELVALLDTAAGPDWFGDGAVGPTGYEIAVYTTRPATLAAVEAILGYVWRGPMAGEFDPGSGVELVSGHVFVFGLDTTKSQRDDVADVWDTHKVWLTDGSPVRTTDRSGPGTKGTRACAGLGPVLVAWR